VLRIAVPADLRDSLPPAVQAYVEEKVEAEGILEVLAEDRDQESRLLYFLEAAGERFSLHFVANPPTHLQTGSRVRVKGLRVERTLILDFGYTGVEILLATLPNTSGEQRTLVILANFQNRPNEQPYTLEDARSVVFNTTNDFYWENSYQQI